MALVIATCQLKGGVGKTTLAINLATCLAQGGRSVEIVDADTASYAATKWALKGDGYRTPELPIVRGPDQAPGGRRGTGWLKALVDKMRKGDLDVVIVDCPPVLAEEQRTAMMVADLVVLPVAPGPLDAWGLDETVALYRKAEKLRGTLPAVIVLTRAQPRYASTKSALEAALSYGLPVLTMGLRQAYAMALGFGEGVVDYAPRSVAADEMRSLTRSILAAA